MIEGTAWLDGWAGNHTHQIQEWNVSRLNTLRVNLSLILGGHEGKYKYNKEFTSSGFLDFGTGVILSWIILCWGGAALCLAGCVAASLTSTR